MQRALRAGWPCAWPILSSHGLFPREGPTTVPSGLVNLSCQGMRPLARGRFWALSLSGPILASGSPRLEAASRGCSDPVPMSLCSMLAMLVTSSDGVSMRRLCVFVLASSLWRAVIGSRRREERRPSFAQDHPAVIYSMQRQLLLEATFVCGTFDGKFGCRSVPGAVVRGKMPLPASMRRNFRMYPRYHGH